MFSKSTEYALRATIYIAQKGSKENKIGVPEISTAINSPESFTAKILQVLSRKPGLLTSITGPGGGFYFSQQSMALPAMAIIEAMEERERLEGCVLGLDRCSDSNPCPMHAQYRVIKRRLISMFEKKTIGQLAGELDAGKILSMGNQTAFSGSGKKKFKK